MLLLEYRPFVGITPQVWMNTSKTVENKKFNPQQIHNSSAILHENTSSNHTPVENIIWLNDIFCEQ